MTLAGEIGSKTLFRGSISKLRFGDQEKFPGGGRKTDEGVRAIITTCWDCFIAGKTTALSTTKYTIAGHSKFTNISNGI